MKIRALKKERRRIARNRYTIKEKKKIATQPPKQKYIQNTPHDIPKGKKNLWGGGFYTAAEHNNENV